MSGLSLSTYLCDFSLYQQFFHIFQVEFVPEDIKRVTPTGIETVDGKNREFDIIVCATGMFDQYVYVSPACVPII